MMVLLVKIALFEVSSGDRSTTTKDIDANHLHHILKGTYVCVYVCQTMQRNQNEQISDTNLRLISVAQSMQMTTNYQKCEQMFSRV